MAETAFDGGEVLFASEPCINWQLVPLVTSAAGGWEICEEWSFFVAEASVAFAFGVDVKDGVVVDGNDDDIVLSQ